MSEENKQKQEVVGDTVSTRETGNLNLIYVVEKQDATMGCTDFVQCYTLPFTLL